MELLKQIQSCQNKQKYIRLTRCRGEFQDSDYGYIIAYSTNFILLQITDEFSLNGYSIFPIETIKEIRHSKSDKFYEMIMKQECIKEKIDIPFNIDLSNWKSVFNFLRKTKLTITIECEEPHHDYFCIGSLVRVAETQVSQLYFSPDGILDNKPTITKYKNITKITFDNRYANVMSKYVLSKK